jgi:hypothetical protein
MKQKLFLGYKVLQQCLIDKNSLMNNLHIQKLNEDGKNSKLTPDTSRIALKS